MRHLLRTLRWSFWLGWQIESNWTDPILFAVYLFIKPLTGSLLLVFMFHAAQAASGGGVPVDLLPFSYLGNAIYMLVGAVSGGMSGAVVADREMYTMLKYLRISPIGLQSYLVGRGLASGLEGLLGAALTVAAGLLLPVGLWQALSGAAVAWAWLLFYLLVGVPLLLAVGLVLAGAVLNMARHGMFLSEGVGSALYLLSGAVFPLDVLPPWLQVIALALPPTYWVEGMRRTLMGSTASATFLDGWSHLHLAAMLLVTMAALVVVAQAFFRWSEERARRLGRYDQTTGY
jgi:ABC-2 type transport system permease protein